ncbi:hypothetical protein DV737_g3371, partial [Chaetothyriales sp. CBS 132003]
MQFMPNRDLDIVTSTLNFSTPDLYVVGGCDLYTTKAAGGDKKLYKSIEHGLEEQHKANVQFSRSLSPPQAHMLAPSLNLSRSSPFGNLGFISSRRTYAYLIATLNASHADYDFSTSLRPSDFKREKSLRQVMNTIDTTLYNLRPRALNSFVESASVGPGAPFPPATQPTWGPSMWRLIDLQMSVKECSIYRYAPDDVDPFEDDEEGSLWSMHYFFFNKARKRVLYLYLRGLSVLSHSAKDAIQTPYWLGDREGIQVRNADDADMMMMISPPGRGDMQVANVDDADMMMMSSSDQTDKLATSDERSEEEQFGPPARPVVDEHDNYLLSDEDARSARSASKATTVRRFSDDFMEDKEKAEKLAAAKKRSQTASTKPAKDDPKETADAQDGEKEEGGPEEKPTAPAGQAADADGADGADDTADADEAAFNAAIHISLQSQLRSTSFRVTAPGLPSPGIGSLQRIEDLERDNQRLAREAAEHEARWRKTEEELEELREDAASNSNSEITRLRAELDLLKRHSQPAAKPGGRRGDGLSGAHSSDEVDSLRKEIEAKDSVIADMQLEISRLRSQLASQTSSHDEHGSHISGLTASLSAAETRVRSLETQLSESRQALTRASEKAVLAGTASTSKDTQIRALQRDLETAQAQSASSAKKAEQLEKKIEAMHKLHRESEARSAARLSAAELTSREMPTLRAKVSTLEAENARLREQNRRALSSAAGADDDGLDELEDEERNQLARRIRELEAQVFELQRGLWRDKRTALQPDIDSAATPRKSLDAGEGFDEYISSGINAFLPSPASPPPPVPGQAGRQRNDSLLQDFDDDAAFDEAAFAHAQREEEAKKMLDHVREVKRGLKNWKSWRLDLVDTRRADAGPWPIFDV